MPDVIIVGGGPAGSCAGIRCAQLGLKAVIIEREAFPRNRPGESLHPGFEKVLDQLDILETVAQAGFLRFDGNWVTHSGTTSFEPFPTEGRGLQASRPEFDALLLEYARRAGVEILQPGRALVPLMNGAKVVGAETSAGKLEAAFVIDAAGRGNWLTHHLNLEIQTRSPRWIAHYCYLEGECPIRDDNPGFFIDDEGWTWTVRVRPGLYNWARLNIYGTPIAEDFVAEELRGLRVVSPVQSADVTWRLVPQCAGEGYFLCGDAAAVLDPTSSHGVVKAITSGILAADRAAQVLKDGRDAEEAAYEFRQIFADWFAYDAGRLKVDYARMFGDRIAARLNCA
ncbi:MAG TPA: NAD(P)/FAD-dependent oxidoreductase [Candidatus Sulfopaludibacter sp.]|jgi:flavin-dependent dehydrogenase|nr:NAD(P)/FAD-dependent oxidoreductase [Candidatus Sulfopaludibacter sp.]